SERGIRRRIRAPRLRPDLLDRICEVLILAADEHDPPTQQRDLARNRVPDPRGSARDDADAAGETLLWKHATSFQMRIKPASVKCRKSRSYVMRGTRASMHA